MLVHLILCRGRHITMEVYGKSVATKVEIYAWLFLALVVVLHGDGEVTLLEYSNRCEEDLIHSTR